MTPLFAHILESAGRAPSAHNTQPWLLKETQDGLEVWLCESRTLPFADSSYSDVLHSIGACIENIRLTLESFGFAMTYKTPNSITFSEPIAYIRWEEHGNTSDKSLYHMIPIRRTSRLPYEPKEIPNTIIEELQSACAPALKLYTITDRLKIHNIQKLTKEATLIQFEDTNISTELYSWLRFSKRDSRWYRDGLNAACLGLNRLESLATKYLLAPKVLKILCSFNLHRIIFSNAQQHAPQTNTICLLTTKNTDIASRIEAGMTLQRIWLLAAKHGLVTHPLSAATDVPQTCAHVKKQFGAPQEEAHVNVFRIGYSKPCARSARLAAEEIVA